MAGLFTNIFRELYPYSMRRYGGVSAGHGVVANWPPEIQNKVIALSANWQLQVVITAQVMT